jgi:hypothetical protein
MKRWLVIFLAVPAPARPSRSERRAGRSSAIRRWPEWRP